MSRVAAPQDKSKILTISVLSDQTLGQLSPFCQISRIVRNYFSHHRLRPHLRSLGTFILLYTYAVRPPQCLSLGPPPFVKSLTRSVMFFKPQDDLSSCLLTPFTLSWDFCFTVHVLRYLALRSWSFSHLFRVLVNIFLLLLQTEKM
jgi:hypothetical protein